MAKRKVAAESDDEHNALSQVSKRAKTEDSEDDVQAGSQHIDRKPIENGKTTHNESHPAGSDDEDNGENNDAVVAEEEERRFEEDHGERIRLQLKARRNVSGVRTSCLSNKLAFEQSILGCCRARNHRVCRDAPVHVPSTPHILFRSSSELHHW